MRGSSHEPERVRRHTAPEINAEIDATIARNIRLYRHQPPEVIGRRIEELDREWDIERVLEANASSLAFAGVLLAATVDRRWLLLSGGVLGFLFLHSTQGWCPPLPLLRRAGIRTRDEINREKFALKHLRGDFDGIGLDESHLEPEQLADATAR